MSDRVSPGTAGPMPKGGCYVTDLDRTRLESAPTCAADENVEWRDREFGQRVHDYYSVRPPWDRAA